MHRKMCNGAHFSVHSNMLKNRNIYNIKQLNPGMLVANIKYVSFVSIVTHKQNQFKYVFTGYKGSLVKWSANLTRDPLNPCPRQARLGPSSATKLEKNQILKMPIQIKYIDGGIGVEFIGSGVVTGIEEQFKKPVAGHHQEQNN